MARPKKNGIDYFPLDTVMDDKVEYIEAKHGLEGFAIIIKLLQKIYSTGYYYEWGEKEEWLFCKRVNCEYDLLIKIINDCINIGIFNKDLYQKYKVLTSAGIQKRYFGAIKRRKDVDVVEKYMIIDLKNINVDNNEVNVCNNLKNVSINTQSKVKKSKVNKKEKINKKENHKIKFAEFVSMTNDEYEKLKVTHGKKALQRMIEILDNYKGSTGKTYKNDYRAILNWVVKRYNEENTKPVNTKFRKVDKFNNFDMQGDYDFAEIEKLENQFIQRKLAKINGGKKTNE